MDVALRLAPERTLALPVTDVTSAAWVTTGVPALPLLSGPGFDAGGDPPPKQLRWPSKKLIDYTQRGPYLESGLG